jgi:hypothetical protein
VILWVAACGFENIPTVISIKVTNAAATNGTAASNKTKDIHSMMKPRVERKEPGLL